MSFSVTSKRLQAISLLAIQFLIHFVRRIFWRPNGLQRFQKNFSSEGLFAITSNERRDYPMFEKCIACFLCDTACPERSAQFTPSHMVLAVSRNLSALPFLSSIGVCSDSKQVAPCEAACPEHVPIRRILDFVSSKAGRA